MEHLAIMHKSFMDKILNIQKTIESRWSMDRRVPYGRVHSGDRIYFKYSSGPVAALAEVTSAKFFSIEKDQSAVEEYVSANYEALGFESRKAASIFLNRKLTKKYVSFFTLQNIRTIKNFSICKDGYGIRASWIVTTDINKLKRKQSD
jgi:hypothetical protein